MKVSNKTQIQSYIVTTAKYDFTVHEKRILYRIIEICQSQIQGKKLNFNFTVEQNVWGDYKFTLPIACFLNPSYPDKNYTRVRKALVDLRNKTFTYEDDKVWEVIGIIEKPKFKKYDEFVELEINPRVFDAILNFSKGFRAYELKTIMSFNSTYAMRFYEIMSQQQAPITYNVDQLKEMFHISGKYERYNDFKKKVITRANEELDNHSPYSFDFEENKTGRKVTSITFYPKYIQTNADAELEKNQLKKKISTTAFLSKEVKDYLMQNFEFSNKELKNNIEYLQALELKLGKFKSIEFLNTLKGGFRTAKTNPKGYVIGACKKKLKSFT